MTGKLQENKRTYADAFCKCIINLCNIVQKTLANDEARLSAITTYINQFTTYYQDYLTVIIENTGPTFMFFSDNILVAGINDFVLTQIRLDLDVKLTAANYDVDAKKEYLNLFDQLKYIYTTSPATQPMISAQLKSMLKYYAQYVYTDKKILESHSGRQLGDTPPSNYTIDRPDPL